MKVLVSGASSGLGLYLKQLFDADSFNRNDVLNHTVNTTHYDVIIHCAANPDFNNNSFPMDEYVEDGLRLTKYLLNLKHNYFVFMSSVDVYPKGLSECTENFKLNPLDLQGKYPRCKLLSEDLVKRHGKNVLILRLSAMLGVDTCQNSLKKMFDGQGLTVSSHSTFNYILHEDVGLFLKHCFSKKVQGVFNLASMSKVSLDEIKTKYNLRNINFGHYLYNTQNISTKKVGSECLFFQKTSIQVVEYFINHLWSKK